MLNINSVTCQIGNEEILYISWHDYDPFMKVNFELYFFGLIEEITRYGIKKLILDVSCRRHDPSETEFKEIISLFLSGLSATELQKMARISPATNATNANFTQILEEMKEDLALGFELCSFMDRETASAWLQKEESDFSHQFQKFA